MDAVFTPADWAFPMMDDIRYPADAAAFELIFSNIERVLDPGRRLPDWPFRTPVGNADICQFFWAPAGAFAPVLEALVSTYADETVSLTALEPTPRYYRENYGSYPAFMASGATIGATYWDLVAHEPGGDPTGAVTYTANVLAIAGSSGSWAVWAERSWDLAIVLSRHAAGPWTSGEVNFVSPSMALASFTEPDFKVPLTPEKRATFLRNVRERGTLPDRSR